MLQRILRFPKSLSVLGGFSFGDVVMVERLLSYGGIAAAGCIGLLREAGEHGQYRSIWQISE